MRVTPLMAVLAILAMPAFAFKPHVAVDAGGACGTVLVNGHPAIRLAPSLHGGLSGAQRARRVARRLRRLIAGGLDPRAIRVGGVRGGLGVFADHALIASITRREARKRGWLVHGVADLWARNIKRFLQIPPLTARPASLLIPVGESRTIRVGGAAEGPLSVAAGGAGLTATVAGPRRVELVGMAPGRQVVTIAADGACLSIPVDVKRYAATVTGAHVDITGAGPDQAVLFRLARDAAVRAVSLQPGAQVDSLETLPPADVGGHTIVPVRIALSGPGYLPVRAEVPVIVRQSKITERSDALLFYSNAPEQIHRVGTLFAARLDAGIPARLLFHHQSDLAEPCSFLIDLFATGPEATQLQVVDGTVDPQTDTIEIGDRAGLRFLESYFSNSGYVLTLQPGQHYLLLAQRLFPHESASGIFHLDVLQGGPVVVQVRAATSDDEPAHLPSRFSKEVFGPPLRRVQARYTVGGRWLFIPVGKGGIESRSGHEELAGNYGVLYDIRLHLDNPQSVPSPVQVTFEPSAGVAGGLFWLDGSLKQADFLAPPSEFELDSVLLQPGEHRDLRIVTMPLAGSNYPATIIVRGQVSPPPGPITAAKPQ